MTSMGNVASGKIESKNKKKKERRGRPVHKLFIRSSSFRPASSQKNGSEDLPPRYQMGDEYGF